MTAEVLSLRALNRATLARQLLLGRATMPALDAVRHLGVSDIRMPLTPERVWRAIHQGGDGGARATAGTVSWGGASTETTTGVSTPESSLGGDR